MIGALQEVFGFWMFLDSHCCNRSAVGALKQVACVVLAESLSSGWWVQKGLSNNAARRIDDFSLMFPVSNLFEH